ncbi:hypothetical protein SUGI_0819470 [Cryptomeria japonica]|nr:hypothetical protein SUGI_0819470 [Cryptomeria japonica]
MGQVWSAEPKPQKKGEINSAEKPKEIVEKGLVASTSHSSPEGSSRKLDKGFDLQIHENDNEDCGSCNHFPMGEDSSGSIINSAQLLVSKVEADGINGKTFRDAIIGSVVQVPEEAKLILVSATKPDSDGGGGNLSNPSILDSNPGGNPPLLGKLECLREAINKAVVGFPNEKPVQAPIIDLCCFWFLQC